MQTELGSLILAGLGLLGAVAAIVKLVVKNEINQLVDKLDGRYYRRLEVLPQNVKVNQP